MDIHVADPTSDYRPRIAGGVEAWRRPGRAEARECGPDCDSLHGLESTGKLDVYTPDGPTVEAHLLAELNRIAGPYKSEQTDKGKQQVPSETPLLCRLAGGEQAERWRWLRQLVDSADEDVLKRAAADASVGLPRVRVGLQRLFALDGSVTDEYRCQTHNARVRTADGAMRLPNNPERWKDETGLRKNYKWVKFSRIMRRLILDDIDRRPELAELAREYEQLLTEHDAAQQLAAAEPTPESEEGTTVGVVTEPAAAGQPPPDAQEGNDDQDAAVVHPELENPNAVEAPVSPPVATTTAGIVDGPDADLADISLPEPADDDAEPKRAETSERRGAGMRRLLELPMIYGPPQGYVPTWHDPCWYLVLSEDVEERIEDGRSFDVLTGDRALATIPSDTSLARIEAISRGYSTMKLESIKPGEARLWTSVTGDPQQSPLADHIAARLALLGPQRYHPTAWAGRAASIQQQEPAARGTLTTRLRITSAVTHESQERRHRQRLYFEPGEQISIEITINSCHPTPSYDVVVEIVPPSYLSTFVVRPPARGKFTPDNIIEGQDCISFTADSLYDKARIIVAAVIDPVPLDRDFDRLRVITSAIEQHGPTEVHATDLLLPTVPRRG